MTEKELELYHFGIKGMKWGIRRYQDENGKFTEAGRRRYQDDHSHLHRSVAGAKYDQKVARLKERQAERYIRRQDSTDNSRASYNKAQFNTAKANVNYAKALGSLSGKNIDAVERKAWAKEMYKSGLPGSINDQQKLGRSTAIHRELERKKGREYVDGIEKIVRKRLYKDIAIGAFSTGISLAYSVYLFSEYY